MVIIGEVVQHISHGMGILFIMEFTLFVDSTLN